MTHIAGFKRDRCCCCRRRWTITSAATTWFGLLMRSAVGCRAGCAEGDGLSGVCAGRSVEALYVRLSEPRCGRAAGWSAKPSRHRGHLVAAQHEARPSRLSPTLSVLPAVFRQFALCRLRLYGRELLAADGTRSKAVNDKDRNFTCGSLRVYPRRRAAG